MRTPSGTPSTIGFPWAEALALRTAEFLGQAGIHCRIEAIKTMAGRREEATLQGERGLTITQTPKYGLPDQGHNLAQLARDVAGDPGAALAVAEVNRVRRPGGALAQADMVSYKKAKDGPLFVLNSLLSIEAVSAAVWSEHGFGMMQKRSAKRQVEQLSRNSGIDAAVDWALTNGSNTKLDIGLLRDMLGLEKLIGTSFDPAFFRHEMATSLRKWK